MDAPRIQYAKTEDGVNIAFWTLGQGYPLIVPPSLVGHLQAEWQTWHRQTLEALAERALVIRYDSRGTGMSGKGPTDFSVDGLCEEVTAVADRLALTSFALFGRGRGAARCLAYSRRFPERVSHLILWLSSSFRARDAAWLEAMMDSDWESYTEIRSRLIWGWDASEASSVASLLRATHSPQSLRDFDRAAQDMDIVSSAAGLSVPTLILHSLDNEEQIAPSRAIAAAMLNAQLLGVPGTSSAAYPNLAGLRAVLDFIAERPSDPNVPRPSPTVDASAFRTILFTDLEAHTAMMQRLGDAKGREVLREHERISREALRAHGGTEVKTIGDSFMASFPSAQKAVECAIALQRAFAAAECAGERLRIRVGINAGEPIAEEDDLFGSSVILASRTKEKAAGGEIFVTDVVRQLVAGKGFAFTDRGEMEMKGFEEPVRLYEVRWQA